MDGSTKHAVRYTVLRNLVLPSPFSVADSGLRLDLHAADGTFLRSETSWGSREATWLVGQGAFAKLPVRLRVVIVKRATNSRDTADLIAECAESTLAHPWRVSGSGNLETKHDPFWGTSLTEVMNTDDTIVFEEMLDRLIPIPNATLKDLATVRLPFNTIIFATEHFGKLLAGHATAVKIFQLWGRELPVALLTTEDREEDQLKRAVVAYGTEGFREVIALAERVLRAQQGCKVAKETIADKLRRRAEIADQKRRKADLRMRKMELEDRQHQLLDTLRQATDKLERRNHGLFTTVRDLEELAQVQRKLMTTRRIFEENGSNQSLNWCPTRTSTVSSRDVQVVLRRSSTNSALTVTAMEDSVNERGVDNGQSANADDSKERVTRLITLQLAAARDEAVLWRRVRQRLLGRRLMMAAQILRVYNLGTQLTSLSIRGVYLNSTNEDERAMALGYLAHLVSLIASIFNVALRYSTGCFGSRSFVIDDAIFLPLLDSPHHIHQRYESLSNAAALASSSGLFPLFSAGVERGAKMKCDLGVTLLLNDVRQVTETLKEYAAVSLERLPPGLRGMSGSKPLSVMEETMEETMSRFKLVLAELRLIPPLEVTILT